MTIGIEHDQDVKAALARLGTASGNPRVFHERLTAAQEAYRHWTGSPANRGRDPTLVDIGPDVAAAFLAQAKSLLDDRRSFDLALASHTVPWVKQLGRNAALLDGIAGGRDRAARMLKAETDRTGQRDVRAGDGRELRRQWPGCCVHRRGQGTVSHAGPSLPDAGCVAVTAFAPRSTLVSIYIHYLVPRVSEHHSWIVDETVDTFRRAPS